MTTDARHFLATVLWLADGLEGKVVNDFHPAIVAGVERFTAAFRERAVGMGINPDAGERSFGGNCYLSLSGHGAGFFDDANPDVACLHEDLQAWAGAGRFEDLEGLLHVDADGRIDLAYVPGVLDSERAALFAVPA